MATTRSRSTACLRAWRAQDCWRAFALGTTRRDHRILTHSAHIHFRFVTVDNEREDGSTVLDVEVKDYPGKGNGKGGGLQCAGSCSL